MWGRAAQGGDRTGSGNLQRAGARGGASRGREGPGSRAGERGWGRRSPAGRTGRCRPGCGRGPGRPWPPQGRSRSGSLTSLLLLPPSPLLPHRGTRGGGGGGLHRACPKGRGRGGRASGRTDPAAADGRSLSPARLQPEPPAAPAHARSGAVTRARRAPPPAGRRHLRAGAGERAAGARRPRALRGARRGRSAPTCWVRVRTHLPFLSPFYYYYFFWPGLP